VRRREIVFAPEAQEDLIALFDWISAAAGERAATTYIKRLEAYCLSFDLASERGRRRDDIRDGLRVIGFERRVTIAFHVDDDRVTILRLFYRGQNWEDMIG